MELTLSERMSEVARCRVHRTPDKPLTMRECEVLAWTAAGFGEKAIARELRCEPGTVKSHLRQIRRQLNARTSTHAVVIAIRRGLIS
jgi:DNA-binding CsgD family transcriptional regulator